MEFIFQGSQKMHGRVAISQNVLVRISWYVPHFEGFWITITMQFEFWTGTTLEAPALCACLAVCGKRERAPLLRHLMAPNIGPGRQSLPWLSSLRGPAMMNRKHKHHTLLCVVSEIAPFCSGQGGTCTSISALADSLHPGQTLCEGPQ